MNKATKKHSIIVLLAFALVASLCNIASSNGDYSLPKMFDDENSPSGKETTWQCVYFGSFPQTEVLDDVKKIPVDDYALDDGVIRDKETYDAVIELVGKDTGAAKDQDILLNGEKYRVESDSNYKEYYGDDFTSKEDREQYYKYKLNNVKYRIFKYEPIKWRIVDVDGEILTLLSDKILMSMQYSFDTTSSWDNSFIRKYLNSEGFLDAAFKEDEKNVILKSKVRNISNDYYDMVSSGDDTEDYIYIPSNEEVFSTDTALKYGFYEGRGVDDPSKRFRSTMYAKYMGAWWSPVASYKGNSFWFMRTNGYSESFATYICDFGYIYERGTSIKQAGAGILPMMKIDASKCTLVGAGVVSSDDVNRATYKLIKSDGSANTYNKNEKKNYELVNLGSYPSREIINVDIQNNKNYNLSEEDYIVDDELYAKLEESDWLSDDSYSIVIIDGDKYLREKQTDHIRNKNSSFHYGYKDKEYHYFKVEPIVWRVLENEDGVKTLMVDKAIDNVPFCSSYDEACYDNSDIRKWLNVDKNYFNLEAFTDDERKMMLDYKLDMNKMKNNYYFGTKSVSRYFNKNSDMINDRFYLLSEEELFYGDKARTYGFSESDGVADVNRRFASTGYAKFKGVWFSNSKETKGNCFYMTRVTGYDQTNVVYVDENGAIYNRGINIKTDDIGFLPVINIK